MTKLWRFHSQNWLLMIVTSNGNRFTVQSTSENNECFLRNFPGNYFDRSSAYTPTIHVWLNGAFKRIIRKFLWIIIEKKLFILSSFVWNSKLLSIPFEYYVIWMSALCTCRQDLLIRIKAACLQLFSISTTKRW